MNIELLRMIPIGQTFIMVFFAILAATKAFKAAANYALTKEKSEVTIDNVNFTNFIGTAAPSTYTVLCILWGLL
ncbi:hypothetical protein [Xiashengella succiniciproducens]|uniref:Uncharacterized protein n=1 Tax=Xiashengella succiniciproducens TaxID=2949635 RepID=A0A9J6ZTI9_9BACT|nr:hypothetical protein [Alkaliflexus sp. Ai-910]URW80616.1 hypothetical protein M9189_04535 [Alkaliflexus sp. Ai-910]